MDLYASIVGHHLVKDPVSKKTHVEYEIKVVASKLHWVVRHRYNAFKELHNELTKQNSAAKSNLKKKRRNSADSDPPDLIVLPSLPGNKVIGNLKPDFIASRSSKLDMYLDSLCRGNDVATNITLMEFFGALSQKNSAAELKRNELYIDKVSDIAKSGDLVLFNTDAILSTMQRKILKAEYDHVGIVVRIPWDSKVHFNLYILESTGDGVVRYNLRQRLRAWHRSHSKMVLRQLNCERNKERMVALTEFVKNAEGKPYSILPIRLINKRSVTSRAEAEQMMRGQASVDMEQENGDQKEQHSRQLSNPHAIKDSYFCSELVASCYMTMGILPLSSDSVSSYLPKSFAEDSDMELRDGASLGKEIRITFDKEALTTARETNE